MKVNTRVWILLSLLAISYAAIPCSGEDGRWEWRRGSKAIWYAERVLGDPDPPERIGFSFESSSIYRQLFRTFHGDYFSDDIATRRIFSRMFGDTITVVMAKEIDLETFLDYSGGGVTSPYETGTHIWFLRESGGETTIQGHLVLEESEAPSDMRHVGRGGIVREFEFIDFGTDAGEFLHVQLDNNSVGASGGTESKTDVYWGRNAAYPRYEVVLALPMVNTWWGSQTRYGTDFFTAERKIEDTDNDGSPEISYRRRFTYEKDGLRSECADPGPIVFEASDGKIRPERIQMSDGSWFPIRQCLPTLLFPPWDTVTVPPRSDSIRALMTAMNQFAGSGQSLRSVPSSPYGKDTLGASVSFVLDGDSLRMSVAYSCHRGGGDLHGCTFKPRTAAIWFDSDLQGDFGFPDCSADDFLLTFRPNTDDSTFVIREYSLVESKGDYSSVERWTKTARLNLDGEQLAMVSTLPLTKVGLQARQGRPPMCGVALETVVSDSFPSDPWIRSATRTPESLHRFDPRSWTVLIVAERRDSVVAR